MKKKQQDWTGNSNSIYKTLGASSHTINERETHDYYATDPKAAELLLKLETFDNNIWVAANNISKMDPVKQSIPINFFLMISPYFQSKVPHDSTLTSQSLMIRKAKRI